MNKSLRIACDGEAASGKSTGAKLISKKYKLSEAKKAHEDLEARQLLGPAILIP